MLCPPEPGRSSGARRLRLSREEVQALGGLHTADEWIAVGQQMKEAGVLFLLLTGGEPLLFPDFKRLYLELRSMGFIITINTNGTLVDEEWADFFGRNKPRRVNITLYGANEEEYSRLCHYPAGFEKTVRGIRLLRQAGVDVKISCSVTKVNQYSLKQIFALGMSWMRRFILIRAGTCITKTGPAWNFCGPI